MTSSPDVLFEPVKLKNITIPNRIAMAPMTRIKSPNSIPGADVAAYYRRRVEGGTGLIITEGTTVNHSTASGNPGVPAVHGEASMAGWKRVVDEVHDAGGCIFPQLWHIGAARQPWVTIKDAGHSPSGKVVGDFGEAVVMTKADIDDVIQAFASSAAQSKDVGFDGIEIHGAHGYLIDQFNWAGTNQRDDAYGGSLENRILFATEIVAAARAAVGPDFPIAFRFSQWKMVDFDARLADTPKELEHILVPLADAGVDLFHASTRRYWEPAFEGSDLTVAGWARKITGKLAMTVGSVGLDDVSREEAGTSDITNLIERLDRHEFDMVAVGRALLTDPDWANKIRDGGADGILGFTKDSLTELV